MTTRGTANRPERVLGYDVIRASAVLAVFLGHIATRQAPDSAFSLVTRMVSPGLTMSLLGFTSAVLLAPRPDADAGAFLIRRLLRIYVSLWLCLGVLSVYLTLLGQNVFNQHSIVHFVGLSSAFLLSGAPNRSPLGGGLWFVSTIVALYLLLPALKRLFSHRNGTWHLVITVSLCVAAQSVMWSMESTWNVVAAFLIGTWVAVNGHSGQWESPGRVTPMALAGVALLGLAGGVAAGYLPGTAGTLVIPLYPFVFVPLLFALAAQLPAALVRGVTFFAAVSYEFYILHFYFIGDDLRQWMPLADSLVLQTIVGFTVTLISAWLLANAGVRVRAALEQYLLGVGHR